ncbi:unnamed protein product [Closterium sp. Naga37s-1]|nr:unnamed protein product [Closterium sp. Naga37s-1]
MLFHAAGAEGSRPTFFEMAAADFLPASLKAAALYALGVRTTLPRHLKPLVWGEKERGGREGGGEGRRAENGGAREEMVAAQREEAVLTHAGFVVLAQHRPSLHCLLDHSDELSGAALLLLEWHSLKTHGASFGESMYGLRRISTVPHRPSPSHASLRTGATAGGAAGGAEGAGRGERAAGGQEGGSASYGMSRKQRVLSLLFLVLLPHMRAKLHALCAITCAVALPARQAALSVCRPPEAEAGMLFEST